MGTAALSEKDRLFVAKYLELGVATDAYLALHPRTARKSAAVLSNRLMKKPAVAAAIAERRQKIITDAEMTADEAMKRISTIAKLDIRRLLGADGKFLPIKDWPDDVALVVKGLRFTQFGMNVIFDSRLDALKAVAEAGGKFDSRKLGAVGDLAALLMAHARPEDHAKAAKVKS